MSVPRPLIVGVKATSQVRGALKKRGLDSAGGTRTCVHVAAPKHGRHGSPKHGRPNRRSTTRSGHVLDKDEVTVLAADTDARAAYKAAHEHGFLYRVPDTLDYFVGMQRFEYKRLLLTDGAIIARPVIPILIRNPYTNQAIEYEALIDSGADRCVFPAVIGEMIGFDIEKGEREYVGAADAGERRPMYVHAVEITPGGYWEGPILLTAAASMPDLSQTGHGLLGQLGFFDRLSYIIFEKPKGFVEIASR